MWHGLQGDDAGRTRLLHEAVDLGFTAIDTAPLYDFGGSEEHLGRALEGHRQAVSLLTKVGLRWDDRHGEILFETDALGRHLRVRRDSRPASVRKDVEESLERLRTDRLDLVQVHHRDGDTPVEETMGELLRLRDEGKLRCIGVCNYRASALRRSATALGDVPLASSQEHYSLVTRSIESEVLPALRDLEAGLLAYSPLEAGLLGGRLLGRAAPAPSRGPLFHPRNARRINAALTRVVLPIAQARDVQLSQVALAWLLHQPGVSTVICGASTREQLLQNAEASALALTAGELETLSSAFAALRIERHPGEPPITRALRLVRRKAAGLRRRLQQR